MAQLFTVPILGPAGAAVQLNDTPQGVVGDPGGCWEWTSNGMKHVYLAGNSLYVADDQWATSFVNLPFLRR